MRLIHQPPEDDADLARALQRHLRHLPVVMLQDRLLPGGLLIDFLAIGPGGVTVIAEAGHIAWPLHVEHVRGVFGARAELLCDERAADRTALVAPVRARLMAVRRIVDGTASVQGALCLDDGAQPEPLRGLEVHGVLVGGPRAVAALSARQGRLVDTEVAALVDLLHATCPPALG
jgi:hypothetical protein